MSRISRANSTRISKFNSELSKIDEGGLVQFLTSSLEAIENVNLALIDRNLRDFVVINLILANVRAENYSAAADLLVSHPVQSLQKYMDEKDLLPSVELLVKIKSDVLRDDAIDLLRRSIDSQLLGLKRKHTVESAKKLNLHACILIQALGDLDRWDEVESLLWRCSEPCNQFPEWKLNSAHLFFVQEKFEEAGNFYSTYINEVGRLLSVPAGVLANHCVCLIMCDRNREAERLLEQALDEEDQEPSDKISFHSTVISLVIGHLYCSKKNFEFGMDRVLAALSDTRKVCLETWFYFKTTFLGMLRHLLSDGAGPMPDSLSADLLQFLDKVGKIDKKIKSNTGASIQSEAVYMRGLYAKFVL